jgi:hypothetical protein
MNEILKNIDQAAKDWNRSEEEKYKKEWYRLIRLYNEIRNHSSPSKRPNLRST